MFANEGVRYVQFLHSRRVIYGVFWKLIFLVLSTSKEICSAEIYPPTQTHTHTSLFCCALLRKKYKNTSTSSKFEHKVFGLLVTFLSFEFQTEQQTKRQKTQWPQIVTIAFWGGFTRLLATILLRHRSHSPGSNPVITGF